MDQFNSNTYKKQSLGSEFMHSCLGKIIILTLVIIVLLIIAVMTVPSDQVMAAEMEDNVREFLQDNDSIKGDGIDQAVDNFSNIFTVADSTVDDHEIMEAYHKYNDLRIFKHALYSSAIVFNNLHPMGVRIGVGVFGVVIPTIEYPDLLLDVSAVRREYNKKLIQDVPLPDQYVGENPNLKPYHYKGNPDD